MKKLELVCGAVLGAGLTYWLWKKQPLQNFNAGKNSMPEANKAQLRDAFNQKTAAIAKEFPTTNVADVNGSNRCVNCCHSICNFSCVSRCYVSAIGHSIKKIAGNCG